jgi:hypothetical protein
MVMPGRLINAVAPGRKVNRMPILNYTTTISVQKTTGEIQEILARAGARTVVIEYGADHIPEVISFDIEIKGRFASFRLPSHWQGVYQALMKSIVQRRYKNEDQSRRVAWRIIKDWTEAQVAIIEAGAAELTEVFMPYMVNPKTNQILFEDFKSGFLLGPGNIIDGEIKEG